MTSRLKLRDACRALERGPLAHKSPSNCRNERRGLVTTLSHPTIINPRNNRPPPPKNGSLPKPPANSPIQKTPIARTTNHQRNRPTRQPLDSAARPIALNVFLSRAVRSRVLPPPVANLEDAQEKLGHPPNAHTTGHLLSITSIRSPPIRQRRFKAYGQSQPFRHGPLGLPDRPVRSDRRIGTALRRAMRSEKLHVQP